MRHPKEVLSPRRSLARLAAPALFAIVLPLAPLIPSAALAASPGIRNEDPAQQAPLQPEPAPTSVPEPTPASPITTAPTMQEALTTIDHRTGGIEVAQLLSSSEVKELTETIYAYIENDWWENLAPPEEHDLYPRYAWASRIKLAINQSTNHAVMVYIQTSPEGRELPGNPDNVEGILHDSFYYFVPPGDNVYNTGGLRFVQRMIGQLFLDWTQLEAAGVPLSNTSIYFNFQGDSSVYQVHPEGGAETDREYHRPTREAVYVHNDAVYPPAYSGDVDWARQQYLDNVWGTNAGLFLALSLRQGSTRLDGRLPMAYGYATHLLHRQLQQGVAFADGDTPPYNESLKKYYQNLAVREASLFQQSAQEGASNLVNADPSFPRYASFAPYVIGDYNGLLYELGRFMQGEQWPAVLKRLITLGQTAPDPLGWREVLAETMPGIDITRLVDWYLVQSYLYPDNAGPLAELFEPRKHTTIANFPKELKAGDKVVLPPNSFVYFRADVNLGLPTFEQFIALQKGSARVLIAGLNGPEEITNENLYDIYKTYYDNQVPKIPLVMWNPGSETAELEYLTVDPLSLGHKVYAPLAVGPQTVSAQSAEARESSDPFANYSVSRTQLQARQTAIEAMIQSAQSEQIEIKLQ